MTDPYHGFDPEFAAASDWARLYRANGLQIVPCRNKIPRLKSWKEYQNSLVPDAQFEAWYGHNGEFSQSYDMGMLTGLASGRILMIDLDIYKTGGHLAIQWWQGLLAVHNNGFELETWKQHTGGGGVQMFFLYPIDWKFAINAKTDINVDVRCQGGFAVLPPTQHASGRPYEWDPGCAPWEIELAVAPDWLLLEVEKLVREHGGGTFSNGGNGQNVPREHSGNNQFDAFGHQTDGRETAMYRMVWRCVVQWRRQCPIKPGDAESGVKAQQEYAVYERNTRPQAPHPVGLTLTQMLDAEGRGWVAWQGKWQYAMKQWEDDVAIAARQPDPNPEDGDQKPDFTKEFEKAQADPTGLAYPFLDVSQIMDKPDPVWAVEGMINEKSFGIIFGPPSSLKTFITLDYALSTATNLATWWGHKINRHGVVVYLCREGTASFKFRIKAWELHRKVSARDAPFYLIEHPTNFMDKDDRIRVIATIEAILTKAAVPVAAIIVDTVSRVLPGAKENLQEDMSLFVEACEAIQHRFECVVMGVHHTNRNGGIRGSSVIPGAGDTMVETRREPGSMSGSIFVHKVKDGEDGYEVPFNVTKIELAGGIVPRSSLVVDGMENGAAPGSGYESGASDGVKRRDILQALHEAWEVKRPWGVKEAIEIITVRWRMKEKEAKQLLLDWRGYQVIEVAVYDSHTKAKGYRKLKDI